MVWCGKLWYGEESGVVEDLWCGGGSVMCWVPSWVLSHSDILPKEEETPIYTASGLIPDFAQKSHSELKLMCKQMKLTRLAMFWR